MRDTVVTFMLQESIMAAHTVMISYYDASIMEGKHLNYSTIFNYSYINYLERYPRHLLLFMKIQFYDCRRF